MPSQFYIPPFNSTLAYSQYDIVYGIDIGGTTHASPYFYATLDVPPGYSPSGEYNYPITQYSRVDDVTTLTYSHTGGPPFGAGAIVRVTGVSANTSVNYTGMIMVGGSGTISYVNPGWPQTQSVVAGAINCLCGSWTTGFFFPADYPSKFPSENQNISIQLGNGYVQSMPRGLNNFDVNPTIVARNVNKRQTKAMIHFVQDAANRPFEILIRDPFLSNQPNQKYRAINVNPEPVSFERYDVSVQLQRAFDL